MRKCVRGKTQSTTCATCGATFVVRVADLKRGWARCCSKRCAARLREGAAIIAREIARMPVFVHIDERTHEPLQDKARRGPITISARQERRIDEFLFGREHDHGWDSHK